MYSPLVKSASLQLLEGPNQQIEEQKGFKERQFILLLLLNGGLWWFVATYGALGSQVVIGLVLAAAIAIWHSLSNRRNLVGLALIAYLVGSQPAIRKYAPSLPFLTLEYVASICLLLTFIKYFRQGLVLSLPALFYGMYIIIEVVGLVEAHSLELGRSLLLPGVSLLCMLILAPNVRYSISDLIYILGAYLIGASGVAILLARVYISGQQIRWATASNFGSSGGMGPVQVSMILAVALFICCLFIEWKPGKQKIYYALLAAPTLYLMVLTFSRNGLYLWALAMIANYILFRPLNWTRLGIILMSFVIAYTVFQVGFRITNGALLERYTERNTSNRITLIQHGWGIFLKNPASGVGTGNFHKVMAQAEYFGIESGAHNEVIRAAAEHGILGLGTWIAFIVTSFLRIIRNNDSKIRALQFALLTMAFAYTSVNGLKLLAQSLLFFLALVPLEDIPTDHIKKSI